jgi:diacylglycerol kinase
LEAERGLSCGLRGDGTLYVYLFVDCLVIAVGAILRLPSWQWIVVGLVITLVLTAELMSQALRALIAELQRKVPESRWTQVSHLATAAVTVALMGGSCVIGAIFWQRIRDLYNL